MRLPDIVVIFVVVERSETVCDGKTEIVGLPQGTVTPSQVTTSAPGTVSFDRYPRLLPPLLVSTLLNSMVSKRLM